METVILLAATLKGRLARYEDLPFTFVWPQVSSFRVTGALTPKHQKTKTHALSQSIRTAQLKKV